jgi:hypothetical protein
MSDPKPTYMHGRSQSSIPLLPYAAPATLKQHNHAPSLPLVSPRKRSLFLLIAVASVVSLGLIASQLVSHVTDIQMDSQVPPEPWSNDDSLPSNWTAPPAHLEEQVIQYPPWVKGPPTPGFRDNLRDDTQYITSWISAGWSAHTSFFPSSRRY